MEAVETIDVLRKHAQNTFINIDDSFITDSCHDLKDYTNFSVHITESISQVFTLDILVQHNFCMINEKFVL